MVGVDAVDNDGYEQDEQRNNQGQGGIEPGERRAFGFRRGVDAGQPPDNAGPRAQLPFPVNGIPEPGDLANRQGDSGAR